MFFLLQFTTPLPATSENFLALMAFDAAASSLGLPKTRPKMTFRPLGQSQSAFSIAHRNGGVFFVTSGGGGAAGGFGGFGGGDGRGGGGDGASGEGGGGRVSGTDPFSTHQHALSSCGAGSPDDQSSLH